LRRDNNSVKDSVKEVIKPHEGLRRHTTRLHQENGCVVILFYDEGMHLTEHSRHLKAQAGHNLWETSHRANAGPHSGFRQYHSLDGVCT
jgi:hypothetical protein